jgi:hypothetical protein
LITYQHTSTETSLDGSVYCVDNISLFFKSLFPKLGVILSSSVNVTVPLQDGAKTKKWDQHQQ